MGKYVNVSNARLNVFREQGILKVPPGKTFDCAAKWLKRELGAGIVEPYVEPEPEPAPDEPVPDEDAPVEATTAEAAPDNPEEVD